MDDNVVKKSVVRLIGGKAMCLMAHTMSGDDGPGRGVFPVLAQCFSVARQTAARLFKRIRAKLQEIDNGNQDDNPTNYLDNPAAAPDDHSKECTR